MVLSMRMKWRTRGSKKQFGSKRNGIHAAAYSSWTNMNQRINDINFPFYKSYGGRGIRICERWFKFENFLIDMGDPPLDSLTGKRYSLERKDNNGNYCKWVTDLEQRHNRTDTNQSIFKCS